MNKGDIVATNMDNMLAMDYLKQSSRKFDLCYADFIYEDMDFSWVNSCFDLLRDDGIFIAQTDYHTVFNLKLYIDAISSSTFINHLVWENDWGNQGNSKFRNTHDDILIYCKGENYKWYPERAQVEKKTAPSKGLNKSGRTTKLCGSVITGRCLTTVAKERVKTEDGKNIKWQKPLSLIDLLVAPFTDENDSVLDPFMGSGTAGVWCIKNNRRYFGIENNNDTFLIATKRMNTANRKEGLP